MRYAVRQLWTAARSLSRQPSVTLPAVLTLAIGIGANTALFTYLAFVVWPRMEAPEPDRARRWWPASRARSSGAIWSAAITFLSSGPSLRGAA